MNFIPDLIQSVDKLLDQYIFNGYHALAGVFSGTLITLLAIYFAGLGWLVIRGLIPLTPMAVAWHMLKAAFVVTVALKWDYFSYFIVNFFTHGMDRLIGGILSTSSDLANPRTITNALSNIWQNGTNIFTELWRQSGPNFLLGNVLGLLGFVVVIGVVAVPLFYLLMSNIALSILLILAPVIMPLFLWNTTREIFNSWLRLLVRWMFTPVLIYAFSALYLKLIAIQIQHMQAALGGPTTASISMFIVLGLIVIVTFKQADQMSQELVKKIAIKDFGTNSFEIPAQAFRAFRNK